MKTVISEEGDTNDKKYCKVKDHYHDKGKHRRAPHCICYLKYSIPREIPIVFHSGLNYDYHFIIKELAEEFCFRRI